ncbi:SpvB/TcaC N-terminal domain-containing protein [Chitinophaga nivalis]|uniref:RHS repeat protein n=2 Tax=Chitinophaga nivalis TaxID=2991709 RepID=A0ABT3IM23_9BACT|nr:SpvB/TcaC N-terminal domain-containing protein [Chitinophaga nivalis]MCW3485028.1 hypothetical protein [Chitinophaga nivalis]
MSYLNSGCKISELPSWVGLGWNLNAGGVITRAARGIADEHPTNGILARAWDPRTTDAYYLAGINEGLFDAESDIFYFNFGQYSGKFFLYKENGQIKCAPSVKSDIQIIPPSQASTFDGYWKVTTPDGNQYYFGETTESREWTTTAPSSAPSGQHYVSGWYLTKIVTSKGNTASLQYKKTGSHTTYSYSETKHTKLISSGGPHPSQFDNSGTSSVINDIVLLERITFPGGKFEFTSNTARQDMSNAKCLDAIMLFDEKGTRIKGYNFSYSYFPTQQADGMKLKLSGITEVDADNLPANKPYVFRYNESSGFPGVNSKAQDHWGYYNGAFGNTSLIPQIDRCNPQYYVYDALLTTQKPADRNPNPAFAILGVLENIKYPTGGETAFEYEGNNYLAEEECEVAVQIKDASMNIGQSVDYPDNRTNIIVEEQTLNLTRNQDLTITLTADVRNNSGPLNFVNAQFRVLNANGTVLKEVSFENAYNNLYTNKLFLNPGTYKVQVIVDNPSNAVVFMDGFTFSAYIAYTIVAPGQKANAIVGGVRCKRIVSFDGISHNNDLVQEFKYTASDNNDLSSGHLYSYPTYAYTVSKQPCPIPSYPIQALRYVTATVAPLGYFQGSHVAYRRVVVTHKGTTDAGSIEKTYSVDPLMNRWVPFVTEPGRDWENGNLLTETIYNASKKKVQETINTYGRGISYHHIDNAVLYRQSEACGGFDIAAEYVPLTYAHTVGNKFFLAQAEVKQYSYDAAGNAQVLSNTTNYAYDHPTYMQLSSVKTIDSKGQSLTTTHKYPYDSTSHPVYNAMVQRNQINAVIEKIKKVGTTQIERQVNNYNFIHTDQRIIEVANIDVQQGTSPLERRFNFSKYNDVGNIQEMNKTDDVREVYLWGYNNVYPVAKIIGADYNTAKQYVNQAILDNVNNAYTDVQMRDELKKLRVSLPAALITTYTYSPLNGLTSETDPAGRTTYYEYDKLGRLKVIKDQQGKILKHYDYKYGAAN